MKRPSSPALLLLVLAFWALPATAAPKPAPLLDPLAPNLSGTQRLDALLNRIRVQQQGTKSIEARFVQHQESSLLVGKEESVGSFSYQAPDRVRWEYLKPKPMSVVIQGDEMTTWYHDLHRAEKIKVGRYSNQVFKYLGASGNMQALLGYFSVTLTLPTKKGEPYRMELLPRYDRIKKRLQSMTLAIDPELFFPSYVKYVEANGDSTEFTFKDFQLNARIPADRFVLKLPPGTATRSVDPGQKAKGQ
jgi:outer membrane lipoprotein-sorting protein